MRQEIAVVSSAWPSAPAPSRPVLAMNLDEILHRLGVDYADLLSTRVWIGRAKDPFGAPDAMSIGPAPAQVPRVVCAITMPGAFLEIEAVKRSRPASWP